MDWQQLQSLYNQKTSVDQTGQLSAEPENTTLKKSSVHIIPTSHQGSHRVKVFLLIIVALGIIAMLGILFMRYQAVRKNARTAATTEQVKTPEQIRSDMIAEIVASQAQNALPPEQLNNLLLGPQATQIKPTR